LTPGVAGLSGEHGQEDGEDHELIERVLEHPDYRRCDEGGEKVELQPRVAELQASRPGSEESLLLVDTDHLSRLGADLEGLLLEHGLTAHETDQLSVTVADRIHREVAVEHP